MPLTPRRFVLYILWIAILIAHAPAVFWLGWPVLVSFHAWLSVPWLLIIAVRYWQAVAADAPEPTQRAILGD